MADIFNPVTGMKVGTPYIAPHILKAQQDFAAHQNAVFAEMGVVRGMRNDALTKAAGALGLDAGSLIASHGDKSTGSTSGANSPNAAVGGGSAGVSTSPVSAAGGRMNNIAAGEVGDVSAQILTKTLARRAPKSSDALGGSGGLKRTLGA